MFSRNYLKTKTLQRIIIHTENDDSIEGLLDEVAKDGVVLRNAKYLGPDSNPELKGIVYVPREQVAFVQVT